MVGTRHLWRGCGVNYFSTINFVIGKFSQREWLGVGTGAIIFNNDGRVFLAKRGPRARNDAGKWDFPGGSVEFGETCAHALLREIQEEFSMQIKVIELLEVVDHISLEEKQHWVSPSFIAKHVGGTAQINEKEKCLAIQWIAMSDIDISSLSQVSKSNYQKFVTKYGINKIF